MAWSELDFIIELMGGVPISMTTGGGRGLESTGMLKKEPGLRSYCNWEGYSAPPLPSPPLIGMLTYGEAWF